LLRYTTLTGISIAGVFNEITLPQTRVYYRKAYCITPLP